MQPLTSVAENTRRREQRRADPAWFDWMPLLVFPLLVAALARHWDRWIVMWSVALAVFAGCKWLAWRTARNRRRDGWRSLAFFLARPGLDARAFMDRKTRQPPSARQWAIALVNTALGILLLWSVAAALSPAGELVIGWVGVAGIILVLHCGLFHALALA